MKKILYLVTVLILTIFITSLAVNGADSHPFSDVGKDAWYYNATRYCYINKLFSGVSDTAFEPETKMSRAMFVTVLGAMTEIDVKDYMSSSFSDVEENSWYTPYIEWAYQNKIASGVGSGLFAPNDNVTREQMSLILYRYSIFKELTVDDISTDILNQFTDGDKVSYWAEKSMSWAIDAGMFSGYPDGSLLPQNTARRSEAAVILYRYDSGYFPKYLTMSVDNTGYDVYTPTIGQSYAYRYGASTIVNDDGSVDMWFSCLGSSPDGELDYISYRHSEDGINWGEEYYALAPTPLSKDRLSCCDPGVIYFGGYYYIGYTSTLDAAGYANSLFVARSRNPEGPYEKWNGSGWGGNPSPFICYEGDGDQWGIGEVSFVELDGNLYIYYTSRNIFFGNFTMVALADASDENWPATIQQKGIAITMGEAHGGTDVKYDENSGKFVAAATVNSFTAESYIAIYDSYDGITFNLVNMLHSNIFYYANNMGLSGSPDCHIKKGDAIYITYAYGSRWGHWSTRVAPVTLDIVDDIDFSDAENPCIIQDVVDQEPPAVTKTIAITTKPHFYIKNISDAPFDIGVFRFDTVNNRTQVTDGSSVTFSNYDNNIISFNGFTCTPKGVGRTDVTVTFDNRSVTFVVIIRPDDISVTSDDVYEWYPYNDTMTVSMSQMGVSQIRGIAVCYNGTIGEAFNDPLDKAIFKPNPYFVYYTGYDRSIIKVTETGMIVPVAKGTTTVKVTMEKGDLSFTITINVVD